MSLNDKVMDLPPEDLKPNPWNSNKMTQAKKDSLRKSIQRNDYFKHVIVREVDGYYQILGGQHRTEIAVEDNEPTIACINLGAISDDQAKQISIIDNGRYGDDDPELLEAVLKDIPEEMLAELHLDEAELNARMTFSNINFDDLQAELDGAIDDRAEEKKTEVNAFKVFKCKVTDEQMFTLMAKLEGVVQSEEIQESDSQVQLGMALMVLAER